MDINLLREGFTVVSFAVFLGIVAWAWSSGNRGRFEEAARLPFDEEDVQGERGRQ